MIARGFCAKQQRCRGRNDVTVGVGGVGGVGGVTPEQTVLRVLLQNLRVGGAWGRIGSGLVVSEVVRARAPSCRR